MRNSNPFLLSNPFSLSDPFSLSAMLDALPRPRVAADNETIKKKLQAYPPHPHDISRVIPPPGFTLTREAITRENQHILINLMISNEPDLAQSFKETISNLNRIELMRMAAFLTSDSDFFLMIAKDKNGFKRLQQLLGKTDDMDTFFSTAIIRCFFQIMTDKNSSYVALRGIQVFNTYQKELMYEYILHNTLNLACDKYGSIALNEIITDVDDPYYRNQLLNIVVINALFLSNDVYGNFVIQHVLKLNNLRCTHSIAFNLCGHFVDLSFKKHGSYIVEKLLEADDTIMEAVVIELLECEGERLIRLARNVYGNFVVAKALLCISCVSLEEETLQQC